MFSTTVTDAGQITLPNEIRDYLKLVSGSRIEFVIDEDGQVKIFPFECFYGSIVGNLAPIGHPENYS
jgi:AbrB family looped-hinge helix DNA binding protein